jgi:microcompartment protein CcmL/EutN
MDLTQTEAVGILEVYGLVCAFMAADSGCKAANVLLDPFDRNKPAGAESLPVPLLVTVKFRGSLEDVRAAMAAATNVAHAITGVVQSHIIAAPTSDAAKLLTLNGFDK